MSCASIIGLICVVVMCIVCNVYCVVFSYDVRLLRALYVFVLGLCLFLCVWYAYVCVLCVGLFFACCMFMVVLCVVADVL